MKILQYENIMTGKKEDLTDIGGLFQKILGVIVVFFVIATGQNLAKKVSSAVPVDTTIDPIISVPVKAEKGKRIA